MAVFRFKQGRSYWAGIDKPFLLPTSLVTTLGENKGFANLVLFDRDDSERPNPPVVAKHSGDTTWDTLAVGLWPISEQTLEIPAEVKWIEEDPQATIAIPGTVPGGVPIPGGVIIPVPGSTPPTVPEDLSKPISPLAIAGIALGAVAVVGIVVIVAAKPRRRNPRRRQYPAARRA